MNRLGDILNKKKWKPKLDSLEGVPIRESIKQTRLYLDNEYFQKGYASIFPHSVTVVYCVLAMFANHKTQTCYPSAKRIMEIGGITNRNTVFEAFKILEWYKIVDIVHRSKGRVPNLYALLDSRGWKVANSINFATVIQEVRKKRTVSKKDIQQSQNNTNNSSTDDTGNHLMDSDKEIMQKIEEKEEKIPIKGKELLERLSLLTKSVVAPCFSEGDLVDALEELYANGNEVEKLGYKPVFEVLLRRGATVIKELPTWIKL